MASNARFLEDLLDDKDLDAVSRWLADRSSAVVAEALGRISGAEQAVAFRLLPKDRALDVFEYLDPVHQAELLEALRDDHVTEIFASLAQTTRRPCWMRCLRRSPRACFRDCRTPSGV